MTILLHLWVRQLLRLSSALVFYVLCCQGQVAAQLLSDSNTLTYPATGLWNGFNNHLNVVECTNFASQNISAQITLRGTDGGVIQVIPFTALARQTLHFILNNFDIADRYGILEYELLPGSQGLGGELRCSTSIYRLSAGGASRAVDYAFNLATLGPLTGESFGLFNSYNPEALATPTFNWLSIYNPGTENFAAEVRIYNQIGVLLKTIAVDLAPHSRTDYPLGHDSAESNGQVVGSYRLIPDDLTAPYGAFVARYGSRSGVYYFAFPMYASKGGCGGEPIFASTMAPAANWAEILNVASTDMTATIEVRNNIGVLLGTQQHNLRPFEQVHVYLNAFLGNNNIGTFAISCSAGGSVVAQSLFYGRASASAASVDWAYGTQARGLSTNSSSKLVVPVNTYLGIVNWYRLVDANWGGATVGLESYVNGNPALVSDSFALPGQGTIDIGPSTNFSADNVGAFAAGTSTSGSALVGEALRVFPNSSGSIGYIMPIVPSLIESEVVQVALQQLVSGLTLPVHVTNAGDGTDRLFIVEQRGKIKIWNGSSLLSPDFLDISAKVSTGGEQGLLSVAFHPSYESNRRFFVNYTRTDGDTVIAEYTTSAGNANAADPASERIIMVVDQPFENHNGGQLQFGPDGYLYIGMGDGGSAGDPLESGQDMNSLLGKMLRIDVDGAQPYVVPADNPFVGIGGARGEIWALGLRNPWRFSFDRSDGRLFLGDVGQGDWEEVDIITRGANYGWNTMEGTHCYDPLTGCDPTGLTLPIAEYSHNEGVSITGGYVYRGATISGLVGRYIFADFSGARIWTLQQVSADQWLRAELLSPGFLISSFGEDEDGEVYVLGLEGTLSKIVEAN